MRIYSADISRASYRQDFLDTLDERTYTIQGSYGAAVGSGTASRSANLYSDNITIVNGVFNISCSDTAWIGSGMSEASAVSSVPQIVIGDGYYMSNGLPSTEIGAGLSFGGNSVSFVAHIIIRRGILNISSSFGPGFASGYALMGGTSYLQVLLITGGSFFVRCSYGAGIGTGQVGSAESTVDNIRIQGELFNIRSSYGAAIGTGRAESGELQQSSN
jgi:hypothetical protein